MTIVVNTRFLLDEYLEGYGYFISETFRRITKQHPEHLFIFVFDRPFDQRFIFGPNVKGIVAGPTARHPVLWKFWYDFKIPAILKKYKADLFVSPDGFCSLATRVPQCMVVHDLAFLHHPCFISKSHLLFWKRYMGKFLDRADSVATVSEFSKADILRHFRIDPAKTDVVYNGVKEVFHPISYEEKQSVKEAYTNGKDYFIYTGAIHPRKNLVNLLKAFSIFKKKQQSGLKLVLAGRLAWKYRRFVEDLKSYKYRDDVVLTGYVEEPSLANLIGAAYAMVYPSLHEGFGVPVLEAMGSGIPVITSSDSSMEEIAGDAALYANATDPNSIAEAMIRIYKDEALGKQLIEKGNERVKQFSWDQTAELLWQTMLKATVK
jgi:glycosyltransferase involved in cell wall biosynthesis